MFGERNFLIGLAVGAVAGILGYKMFNENGGLSAFKEQPLLSAGEADIPLAELMRQKEEIEDMIAAAQGTEA